jgi:hypothetical protein
MTEMNQAAPEEPRMANPPRGRVANALGRAQARLVVSADDLAWLAAAGAALAVAGAIAWLAPLLSNLYPSPSHDVFTTWRGAINPEPLEEVRSVIALSTPSLVAAIVVAFGGRSFARPALDPLIIAVQVAAAVLLVVAVLHQPQAPSYLRADCCDHYLISTRDLAAGVAIGILLTAVAVRPPERLLSTSARDALERVRSLPWLALLIAIAVTVVWLLPAVNTDGTLPGAGSLPSSHIPVQGEDYFAAVNGRTPLVDYISQYANLLPILLEPMLKAVGPSITSVSISMCVISAIAMAAIYFMFLQVTRGAWSALALYVPWVALSMYPWIDTGAHREFNGIYYGVFPARYFGPFLLAWLCAMGLRGRRIPTFALFALAGVVVLNNYEFGIGALLSLIAAAVAGWDRNQPVRHRLTELLAHGGAGLIAALALVCAITLARTGELPDFSLLTYYNRLFLRESFGLAPMSSLGLHWALYATYSAVLVLAAVRYVRREADRALTGMLAFSGVFGLVTSMYFVGRSVQIQLFLLFPAWGLALGLAAWAAARSLRAAGSDRVRLRRLLIPACCALIGFGVMVAAITRLPQPQRQVERLRNDGTPQDLKPVERLVESWTTPGQHILLIGATPDHLIADRAKVVNTSPLNGITSLISPAEADRSIDQLEDAGGDLVIERVTAGGFIFPVPQFADILRDRGYTLVGDDPTLHIRVWRRMTQPTRS